MYGLTPTKIIIIKIINFLHCEILVSNYIIITNQKKNQWIKSIGLIFLSSGFNLILRNSDKQRLNDVIDRNSLKNVYMKRRCYSTKVNRIERDEAKTKQ